MPDQPPDKFQMHPWRRRARSTPAPATAQTAEDGAAFADLVVSSNFSFLRGASHPEELVARAAALGASAMGLTDRHTVSGMVRAHLAAREAGIHLVPGARVELWRDRKAGSAGLDWERRDPLAPPSDRVEVALHALDLEGWRTLCRLLTIGKRAAPKGHCLLTVHDLLQHHVGIAVTVLPTQSIDRFRIEVVEGLATLGDLNRRDALSLGVQRLGGDDDDLHVERIADLGRRLGVPLLAQNDVHLHARERRAVQDVLTCIRLGCVIETAGRRLWPNDERRLRNGASMSDLFFDHPEAVARSLEIVERSRACRLDRLRYQYPAEVVPKMRTPMEHLRELVERGARTRFGPTIPTSVRRQLEHELELIDELDYPRYFLTVEDLVRFARSRSILCQGRGAAANSAVCYCLGITAVDPTRIDMLFERFISRERDEPPDIDIDFEHERREEVLQYVYEKYGRDRAALVAEVVTFRGRSAMREVAMVMGLSRDLVDRLATDIEWWIDGVADRDRVRELGLDPEDPTIRRIFLIAEALLGFPRHLSQHVGGFVITDGPLWGMVPVENAAMADRTVIEWDKDDVDAMGMLKIDCLSLGMLSCIRRTIDLINEDRSERDEDGVRGGTGTTRPRLRFHEIPAEDPDVYEMFSRADTVGVFQIESRAQMSMLPRLRPRCFYDLVIEVAIVRPGPIQGDMVHPYLRRRDGEEIPPYPDRAVRRILEKTLGVPLFQEQAMALAVAAAGFTPGEADELRRAIAAWKRKGDAIAAFGERLQAGMAARGYDRKFAEQVFTQIRGFSGYGFPESHAASFALLVYASGWLKCRAPAAFAAALVNSQPMGFYAPAQIIRDAREHGVEIRRIDVQASDWDCTLERGTAHPWDVVDSGAGAARPFTRRSVAVDQPSIRLGLRLVRGLVESEARKITDSIRRDGPFQCLDLLRRASGASVGTFRRLARADAFRSLGIDRQQALWRLQRWDDDDLPLFEQVSDTMDFDREGGRADVDPDDQGRNEPQSMVRRVGKTPPDGETRDLAGVIRRSGGGGIEEPPAVLPPTTPLQSIVDDYASSGLSVDRHPLACMRRELAALGVRFASEMMDEGSCPGGARISVAGVVLVRQRPSTAGGIVFLTLEDETGIANLIVKPRVYARHRRTIRHAGILIADGRIERRHDVVHLVVSRTREHLPGENAIRTAGLRSRDFH